MVAEAETWLGSPQAPFVRPVPGDFAEEGGGRRKRRPENKRKPQPRARRYQCAALTHMRSPDTAAIVEELDLPSVPEYNPTPEQFKDPLAYIQTIYDQAALYGVCIINPPKESWNVSVGPKDWESACKTSGRMSAFAVKRQKLLNAQRKTGDPGFEYLKNELNLAQYEKETHRVQEKVRKTLPRPVNIDDEIDVETNFFDTMAREAGTFSRLPSLARRAACLEILLRGTQLRPVCTGGDQSVIYGNDVEGSLLEHDDAVKDNPWAPMRISLHG